ncbi:MAG: class F sortase [Blastococcus sp.]
MTSAHGGSWFRSSRRRAARSGLAVLLGLVVVTTAGCDGARVAASAPSTSTSASAPSSAPATTTPGPAQTLAKSAPVRVLIPAIHVDSPLMALGLQADGRLQVPATGFPAGWFTDGPTPGELGPAVLAGHVDWGGSPGVFYRLRELVAGDDITVDRRDGSTVVFRVTRVDKYAKDAFPTHAVYGDIDHAGLRVITCGGAFDHRARSYVDNIVVFADLVSARRA